MRRSASKQRISLRYSNFGGSCYSHKRQRSRRPSIRYNNNGSYLYWEFKITNNTRVVKIFLLLCYSVYSKKRISGRYSNFGGNFYSHKRQRPMRRNIRNNNNGSYLYREFKITINTRVVNIILVLGYSVYWIIFIDYIQGVSLATDSSIASEILTLDHSRGAVDTPNT